MAEIDPNLEEVVRKGRRAAFWGVLFVVAFVLGVYVAVAYFGDDGRIALTIPANDPARAKK